MLGKPFKYWPKCYGQALCCCVTLLWDNLVTNVCLSPPRRWGTRRHYKNPFCVPLWKTDPNYDLCAAAARPTRNHEATIWSWIDQLYFLAITKPEQHSSSACYGLDYSTAPLGGTLTSGGVITSHLYYNSLAGDNIGFEERVAKGSCRVVAGPPVPNPHKRTLPGHRKRLNLCFYYLCLL